MVVDLAAPGEITPSLVIYGHSGERLGRSVYAENVNGDSRDGNPVEDIVIGAYYSTPYSDTDRIEAGAAYVIMGRTALTTTETITVDLVTENAAMTILGAEGGDRLGRSVSSGDINGDGYADLVVGAQYADSPRDDDVGVTYVITGSIGITTSNPITFDLSSTTDINKIFTYYGVEPGDETGFYVSSGNFNNDGFDDVLIGAYMADSYWADSETGQAYVAFGSAAPSHVVYLSNEANVTIYGGEADERLSRSLAAGDVNGDNYDDIVMGASQSDRSATITDTGRIYVIYGGSSISATINLSETNAADLLVLGDDGVPPGYWYDGSLGGDSGWYGDECGRATSTGDLDGDGIEDLIAGGGWAADAAGEVYVVYGGGPITLHLTPTNQTVDKGQRITYTVTATDTFRTRDVSHKATFTITNRAGGSWNDNVYTTGISGTWTVTATYRGAITTTLITVINNPPTADDDTFAVDENSADGTPVGTVSASDPDAGDSLTYAIAAGNTGDAFAIDDGTGEITVNDGAVLDYETTPTFDLTVVVTDTGNLADSAAITVNLNDVNEAPTADDDAYATSENAALTVLAPGVLGNDTDVDSTVLTATLESGPANGVLNLNLDGSFAYTPTAGFTGDDTFIYVTSDGALTDTTTVTITVSANAPTVNDDGYTTDEDVLLFVPAPGVLDNDTDPNSDPLTATLGSGPTNGALVLNEDGSFVYTPTVNYNGSDSFTYRATDGTYNSNLATVVITVTAENDAPIATDDSGAGFETDEDTSFTTGDVLANDTDAEIPGGLAVTSYDDSNLSGALSYNGNGTFDYDPNGQFEYLAAGEQADDTFTYVISDTSSLTDAATVTMTIGGLNDAPVADDDMFVVGEDSGVNVLDVLDGDTDPDTSDTLIVHAIGTLDQGGTATNGDSDILYTPAADFVGEEVFTYTVSDRNGGTATATVTVTVSDQNDPPTANAGGSYSGNEGSPINLDGSGSNDLDGSIATYEWDCTDDGSYDISSADPTGNVCTYPDDGLYTVRLRVTDNQGATDTGTATVTVDNVAPTLTLSGDASVSEGTTYILTLSDVIDPGDDTIITCTVDWGDGGRESCLGAIGDSIPHTYVDGDNSHTIFVDLSDEDGSYDSVDTLDMIVNNVPPIADVGGPYVGIIDSPVVLSAAGSYDPGRADTLTYQWDWDADGDYDYITTTVTVTRTWSTAGVYTVTLRVTDGDGGEDTDTANVTVALTEPDRHFIYLPLVKR
jgi:VCBS repeat-containing protein